MRLVDFGHGGGAQRTPRADLDEQAPTAGRKPGGLVTEILEDAVTDETPRELLQQRLRAEGRLVEIEVSDDAPSFEKVREMLRGDAGKAVLEALEEDRAGR